MNTTQMNHVFANCSEEDEIYSLTVKEIVEAQKTDITLKHFSNSLTAIRVRAGTKTPTP